MFPAPRVHAVTFRYLLNLGAVAWKPFHQTPMWIITPLAGADESSAELLAAAVADDGVVKLEGPEKINKTNKPDFSKSRRQKKRLFMYKSKRDDGNIS